MASKSEAIGGWLVWEYGEKAACQKREDFIAIGPKPMSIIAHHNAIFEQIRSTFISGSYFPALTGACSLGERILNHLIIDLRHDFRSTPQYKRVQNKDSFADWGKAIDVLSEWGVLLPSVAVEFKALAALRHKSLHFNQSTYDTLRDDALKAIAHIATIVGTQFGGFGTQPWFISGTAGHCFIKREFESDPFVRRYYLPLCPFVGVQFGMAFERGGWLHIDIPDYGDGNLSDDEFCDAYNNRDPATVQTLQAGQN